jgi:hypothetical protein
MNDHCLKQTYEEPVKAVAEPARTMTAAAVNFMMMIMMIY